MQAKLIYVYVDNSPLKLSADSRSAPTSFIMRRAPGHVQYNYCQDILFQSKRKESQLQVPSDLPRGCILFTLCCTHVWSTPIIMIMCLQISKCYLCSLPEWIGVVNAIWSNLPVLIMNESPSIVIVFFNVAPNQLCFNCSCSVLGGIPII